jgi:uncharacterized integral membrane protein
MSPSGTKEQVFVAGPDRSLADVAGREEALGREDRPVERLRGSVTNRTHRVVRAQAKTMQARRSRNRALFLPLVIASSMIVILVFAFWVTLDEYELVPTGVPDARFQLPVLLMWFLPVTGALLIVALLRRFRAGHATSGQDEETR